MFSLEGVTLRPMDITDLDRTYAWHCDLEIEIASGWGRRQSRTTFQRRFEQFLESPPDDLRSFGIEAGGDLVGRVDLALIDRGQLHAMLGLFIGERSQWGRGVGKKATRLMLDYGFTVENLARIYAQIYDFNERSLRLMRSVGFTHEGVMRKHEVHNGARRDVHLFGVLKDELYARYPTIFRLPESILAPKG